MYSSSYIVSFGVYEGLAYDSELELDLSILSHHHSWLQNKKLPMNLLVMLLLHSPTTLVSSVLSVYSTQHNHWEGLVYEVRQTAL